jgi:hypothetical protein
LGADSGAEAESTGFPTGEKMVEPKRNMDLKEIDGRTEAFVKSPKVKFEVFGEEMIEKKVKWSGNTGRIYLPPEWVGKCVKIVRVD